MELVDFEWRRCRDHHQIVPAEPPLSEFGKLIGGRPLPERIEPCSHSAEIYRPLSTNPALFKDFANREHSRGGMLEFCNAFGLLDRSTFVSIEDALEAHAKMHFALNQFEVGDPSKLIELFEVFEFARTSIKLRPKEGGRVSWVLEPDSLLHAMWLQFGLHAESEGVLLKCQWCGKPIRVGTGTKRRNTSRYCSNACKVAAYKLRKEESHA